MELHAATSAGTAIGTLATSPGRRVLVVDDSAGVRELITLLLEDRGCEVATAPDGRAALDLVEHWRPDVILLDSSMPVMGGQEFARHYRQRPAPHAPIVMLTGEPDGRRQAAAIDAAYLQKPFAPQALLHLIGVSDRGGAVSLPAG